MKKDTLRNIGIFIGCLILCQAAGAVGTIATIPNIPTWYASLNKPPFQPPNYLFGPVWGILYTLMAVALYKLIQSSDPRKKQAIKVFAIQLVMNAAWSFFFFQFHWLAFSLAEIFTLFLTLISFCVITEPFCRTAMYCFLPYIAWVGFATLLNASILYLN